MLEDASAGEPFSTAWRSESSKETRPARNPGVEMLAMLLAVTR